MRQRSDVPCAPPAARPARQQVRLTGPRGTATLRCMRPPAVNGARPLGVTFLRTAGALGAAVALSVAAPARAQAPEEQSDTSPTRGFFLNIQWTEPTALDGRGRLDCVAGTENCGPLNALACNEDARNIGARLTRNEQTPVLLGSRLWAWLQNTEDCTGNLNDLDERGDADLVIRRQSIEANDPLVATEAFEFPSDGQLINDGTFTTQRILDFAEACGEDGTDQATVYLCFGFDLPTGGFNTQFDDTLNQNEPRATLRIPVDTVAPPDPTVLVAQPLDGAVRMRARVPDPNDVDFWTGVARPLETGPEQTDVACADWATSFEGVRTERINASGSAQVNIDVAAENGVRYQACVFVEDEVGNVSTNSPTETVTPTDECDFIECYPGELKTGYCGHTGVTSWAVLLGTAAILRRRRRLRIAEEEA